VILALAVVLGLVAGLIRYRGRLVSHLAGISLRSAWLVLLALALQYPLLRAPFGPRQQVAVQQALFLFSHLLLLVFVWQNRRLPTIWIVGLGVLCNLLVILANGGFMPISPETLGRINPGSNPGQFPAGFHYGYSKDVILLRPDTNFWFLSDRLVLPAPFPWPSAFSVGDLLIAVGIILVVQAPGAPPRSSKADACPS
jgi:hypothetical protein